MEFIRRATPLFGGLRLLSVMSTINEEILDSLSMKIVQKVLPASYFMHFFLPLNMSIQLCLHIFR